MGEINKCFLFSNILVVSISAFQFGYALGQLNPLIELFKIQIEGFNDKLGLINTMVPIGALIGSFSGGPLGKFGRRKLLMLSNFFLGAAVAVVNVQAIWSLMVGRFILGMTVGAASVMVPLFISEISPPSLSGPLGTVN